MNDELAWRQQLRALQQPEPPPRDLWTLIEARLDPPVSARRARTPWRMAAALASAFLLAGSLAAHLQQAGTTPTVAAWQATNRGLDGATIEFSAARMELQQALQQSPDSPLLQRLLARTQQQQSALHHLRHEAG